MNLFYGNQRVYPQNPYGLPINSNPNTNNPNAIPINPYANPFNPYSNPNEDYNVGQYYSEPQTQNTYPDAVAMPINSPQPAVIPSETHQSTQSENSSESSSYIESSEYNPFDINYQDITIDQWQQIPSHHTEYSQYWSTREAFNPHIFSENSKKEKKFNDLCWSIFFWIQFLISIFLLIYLILLKSDGNRSISIKIDSMKTKDIIHSGLIGLSIGIISNIIHYLFLSCCPLFYLGTGMCVGFIYSIMASILYLMYGGNGFAFVFPIFYLIFLLLFYFFSCQSIELSSKFLIMSSKLLTEYPSLICFCLYQVLFTLVIDAFFCALIFYIQKRGINNLLYLYVAFSYFWTTLTFEYVEYLTVSGVAASWYFLNDTDYFPNSPVCQSYKRAMTTSFGSAALAGFILSIVEILEFIIDSTDSSINKMKTYSFCCCIFQCIARCILCVLKCCLMTINRFALVYCATFGIPYVSGCKRVIELMVTRFVRVITTACIIKEATRLNSFIFGIASAFIGYAFGHLMFKERNDYSDDTKEMFKIFICCFALLFTFGIFKATVEPQIALCDTLLVCFFECPENLKTTAYDLYELIAENYHDGLVYEMSRKGIKDRHCCDYGLLICCL